MRLIYILLFLSLSHCVFSQSPDCELPLHGMVEDNQGVSLPGATLWIEAENKGTSTNEDGSFTIPDLCTGNYRVLIRYVGYEDQILTVRIPANRSLIIKLKPSTKILHDIVIEGDHLQKHNLSQSFSIITERELNATRGKPLGEMLQHIPGVTSMMTGPGIFKPVVHGLHSQRLLVLNNAIRQEGQQWGVEHAPEIDTYIASEMEVVKGAEAVRYGAHALGGVIIIGTPPLHHGSSLGGELNLALNSNNRMGIFSGSLEGGLKKNWGWRVQGTVKKGGDFHAPSYNLSNTGIEELNFSTTLGLKKESHELEFYFSSFNTEIGILRSAHTGNLEDLQNSIINERPWYINDFSYSIQNPRQQVGHHLVKLKASKKVASLGTLNFLYGGQLNQRKEFDIRRGERNSKPALSLDLFSHVADVTLDHSYKQLTGSIGINGTYKINDNILNIGILPDYEQLSGGLFLIEKIKINKLLVEAGVRFDHQYLKVITFDQQDELIEPDYSFNYLSGSLGISYFLNTNSRLSSHVSIAARPPHASELFSQGLHHSAAAIEEGLVISNGVLKEDLTQVEKEGSYNWVNTYQYEHEKFSLELTGYINYITDYIYLRPYETRLTIRGYFPAFKYEQSNALLTGGDLLMNWNISNRLAYKVGGSIIYARNTSLNDKLPLIPPSQIENSITYTWPRVGNWKNFYVSVIVPTVRRQYNAPETIYPADVNSNSSPDKLFDFMPSPAGYTLVNMEMGAKFPFGNNSLAFVLGAENIANTSYRNYMNRLRYFADETGRNFTLRIKYNFHSH